MMVVGNRQKQANKKIESQLKTNLFKHKVIQEMPSNQTPNIKQNTTFFINRQGNVRAGFSPTNNGIKTSRYYNN